MYGIVRGSPYARMRRIFRTEDKNLTQSNAKDAQATNVALSQPVLCVQMRASKRTGGTMKTGVFEHSPEDRHVARVTLRRLRRYCSVGSIARVTEVPIETIRLFDAGKAEPPTGFVRKLERLERLLLARQCVTEFLNAGLREFQIAKRVGLSKETICHILRDDFWCVAEKRCHQMRQKLLEHNASLFEHLLASLEIVPFETSGQATDASGWKKRADYVRRALADSYKGLPHVRRSVAFQAIVAQVGPPDDHNLLLLIWARGRTRRALMRALRHEGRHVVERAEDELGNTPRRRKNKALLRICK
jgi:hypothetical protein